ncbi:MAG TPA: FAD-binding oxidoreductase [Xanthomonadales bacterium]|nr:FAD-binding oxidoreductase [Xanthomonadales bacterium]
MTSRTTPNTLQSLRQSVPDVYTSSEPEVLESHGRDWTRFHVPAPLAIAFPESIQQVQRLVSYAATVGLGLVPSGGRTGLSGGALAAHGELVVSFDRMRRILHFDAIDRSVTFQAGVVTATLQSFARERGFYYPVSFAAEGSSQLGGNIATNAGGIRVLRYGMTRDWVSGLKVVTGRGELLDCNRGLIKNASGYDLRHLFIGSEGTLGMIVEATVRLTDQPPPGKVMLLGISNMDALMKVFEALRASLELSAFEFLADQAMRHVCRGHGLSSPIGTVCPWYVVTEFDCPGEAEESLALQCFSACMEKGWLLDGVISQSEQQNQQLWRFREGISEAITHLRPYKNDLSVRVSSVPGFLHAMDALMNRICPDYEVIWYGHIGDGNLHMNIIGPQAGSASDFESRCQEISEQTYALTQSFGGSISAEHGIGVLKQPWLGRVRSPAEITMMQGIKQVFDPAGIMNPGKLLPLVLRHRNLD